MARRFPVSFFSVLERRTNVADRTLDAESLDLKRIVSDAVHPLAQRMECTEMLDYFVLSLATKVGLLQIALSLNCLFAFLVFEPIRHGSVSRPLPELPDWFNRTANPGCL